MMTTTRIFLLIVCAWIFAGCQVTNSTINDKPYSIGQQLDSPIPETKSIFWLNLNWKPTVSMEPRAVGAKGQGGFVYLSIGPKKWLVEGAKLQFKSVGLEEGAGNADDPSIFIIAEQFFVEYSGWTLTAVTILDVSVTLPKKDKIFQRRFVGKDSSFPMFVVFPSSYYENLLKSAQLAFHEAAQETRKLIDREER